MSSIKSVCVFLGSTFGSDPAFIAAAKVLGEEMAKRNIHLIYGGGRLGLMGVLADSVLAHGGHVVGVMPTALYEKEVHLGLPELHVVTSMQHRKAMMAELSDAFLVMPGGLGTLEELFEVWSAIKIGLYQKPCGLLNLNAYYEKLIGFADIIVQQGFMERVHLDMLSTAETPGALLDALQEAAHFNSIGDRKAILEEGISSALQAVSS